MQNQRARLNDEMHVYKAHVKNGKIEIDVDDLPEGAEVQVTLVKVDDLSPEDLAAIDEGIADIKAGRVFDRSVIHEDFRARRKDRVLGKS